MSGLALALWAGPGAVHAAEEEEDVLASVPGEILDTAIAHCRLGEREQALPMFQAIREQLDPPPALLRLVNDLEASGCAASILPAVRGPRVLAGIGYDSNVTQGITARSLTILNPNGGTSELELDPASYRPIASAYQHLALDLPFALPAPGWNGRVAAAARRNERARDFDVGSYGLSISRTLERPYGSLRLQGEAAELWLGGRRYQRTSGLQAQALVPGDLMGEGGLWLAHASVLRVGYLTQRTQDAVHWELGFGREQRLSSTVLAFADVAVQNDRAQGARPGGDRTGHELVAGLVMRAGEWLLRPEVRYQHWRSEALFAPGLIEERRRNRTWQVNLAAERKLTARQTLLLEWRSRASNDVIPLYQYRAHSASVAIQHQF